MNDERSKLRKWIVAILGVILLVALGKGLLAELYPLGARMSDRLQVLVADEAHSHLVSAPSNPPASLYRLSATDAFELDVSALGVLIPEMLAKEGVQGPNSVQVVCGRDQNFSVAWAPQGHRLRIAGSTLRPNANSGPFRGFQPGQTVVIAVGHLQESGATFVPLWVGMARVE